MGLAGTAPKARAEVSRTFLHIRFLRLSSSQILNVSNSSARKPASSCYLQIYPKPHPSIYLIYLYIYLLLYLPTNLSVYLSVIYTAI